MFLEQALKQVCGHKFRLPVIVPIGFIFILAPVFFKDEADFLSEGIIIELVDSYLLKSGKGNTGKNVPCRIQRLVNDLNVHVTSLSPLPPNVVIESVGRPDSADMQMQYRKRFAVLIDP